ncbi:MAG: hypothetical protein ACOY4Q_03770 [Bacillota bacterium]
MLNQWFKLALLALVGIIVASLAVGVVSGFDNSLAPGTGIHGSTGGSNTGHNAGPGGNHASDPYDNGGTYGNTAAPGYGPAGNHGPNGQWGPGFGPGPWAQNYGPQAPNGMGQQNPMGGMQDSMGGMMNDKMQMKMGMM